MCQFLLLDPGPRILDLGPWISRFCPNFKNLYCTSYQSAKGVPGPWGHGFTPAVQPSTFKFWPIWVWTLYCIMIRTVNSQPFSKEEHINLRDAFRLCPTTHGGLVAASCLVRTLPTRHPRRHHWRRTENYLQMQNLLWCRLQHRHCEGWYLQLSWALALCWRIWIIRLWYWSQWSRRLRKEICHLW